MTIAMPGAETFADAHGRSMKRATIPAFGPVPLLFAGRKNCRWPLWEGERDPKLFCGARRVPGSCYCLEHWRLSRRP